MSLSSATSRTKATGSDSTSVYNYNFRIFQSSDLLVTVRNTDTNVETLLVLTTDYTVSGVGQTSGSITLVNAGQAWIDSSNGDLLSNYIIVIRRVRPLQQNTSIRNQGTFYAAVHEDAFDDMVMKLQQLWDYINRAVTLPETLQPSDFNPVLPSNLFINPPAGAVLQINPTQNGFTLGSPLLGWQAVDLAYGAFSIAATSKQVKAFSLPAGCILMGVAMKHSTLFTGSSISAATCDLGTTGDPDKFLSAFDVHQSVADSAFVNATVQNIQSFANATDIFVRANSTGANLSALSQGTVRIYYWYMNLNGG